MRRLLMLALGFTVSGLLILVSHGIAKETDGDMPLTGISASLQPDLVTGTLTGSIPIEVPPGRNGMQPNLMLSYASSGGNGWVGMGWKLEMGTIERQTRWGVLYQPTTAEEQAGKVYTIRLNGISADLVQDATDPLLYHEKVKSGFLRIKKLSADGTSGWEITDTKGTKYKFGTGATTRVQGTVSGATQIFRWCLERVDDRDGNYMTMAYTADQGQEYLSQIDYTGNGATAPTNSIKFYLETRPDAADMYTANFNIKTANRLKTIEVRANGSLVRAYKATYTLSPTTTTSLLTTLQPYGKNATLDASGTVTGGTVLPPAILGYIPDSVSFNSPSQWADLDGAFVPGTTQYADVNGDAKADLIFQELYAQWNPGNIYLIYSRFWVAVSTGTGFASPTMWVQFNFEPYGEALGLARIVDVNGDGSADLIFQQKAYGDDGNGGPYDNRFWVSLSTGTGFTTPAVWLHHGGESRRGQAQSADLNGDGKTDLIYQGLDNKFWVSLSTGTGFTPPAMWVQHGGSFVAGQAQYGDLNGDGKTDLIFQGSNNMLWVSLSTGTGFTSPAMWIQHGGSFVAGQAQYGDLNGDGKTDLIFQGSNNMLWVSLSTGTGFTSPAMWIQHGGSFVAGQAQYGDLNGDGMADLILQGLLDNKFWVSRSTVQGSGQNTIPNLLVTLANGPGGATTIQYLPSTQYSNAQLPYPVQSVSVITTCDYWNSGTSTCTGISSAITYSYTGGYHHIGERDFRGFKTATVTSPGASDVDKTVTTTWFHQGNELTPIDTENPGLANGYMKGQPYRVEVRRKSDNLLYTKSETTYHDDRIGANTTAPWFTPPSQADTILCDGGPCKTTRVAIAATDYDAYGNVLRESHHGDTSVTGDEKTVSRAFLANTTDYVVSAPARETIYKGLSVAAADKLAETLFYYDGTGTGACTAVPTGSNTTVTKGKLTKVERWLSGGTNPISGMEYDPTTGVLLCSRDPLGNKTTMTYDSTKTFVLSTTNQLGHVTTTVYSGVNGVAIDPATGFYGTVKSVTDPNGKVVNHEYDALGRKTKTTAPDGLITTMTYPTLAEYGVIGTQKITISTSGASLPATLTSSTFFDGLGRTFKKESSGPNGTTLVNETQYDVRGQVFRTSLPYFKTTESTTNRWRTMTYDALGRVVQVTHPDTLSGIALTSKSCYAPFVTVTLDPSGARKRETKDAYGRVVKIEEYSTTASTCDTAVGTPYATTNYTYDLLGNLTKVMDALGNRTTMRYDTLSRKLAMSDPDMSTNGTTMCADLTTVNPAASYPWYAVPCWNYQYDAAGNLTRQTDAKNQHLWFRYDGLNRRTQKDYTTQKAAGSGDVRYVYDDTVTTFNRKGRLKQVVDAATNVTFEYDAMGRTSKSTRVLDGTTYVTTSVYDGLGRLKDVTYPGATPKTVEYLYTGPILERVRDKSGSGTTIYAIYSNYTSLGQAQTITYGNGVVTTSTFADPAHSACIPANSFKLCTLKTQKGTNPLYQDLTYTFTADGNMDLITDPINGNQDFGYDNLDRLTTAIGPYGNGGAVITRTYTYNEIGNILTNSWLTAGTYTYPTSGAGVVRPHAVRVAGPYSYSYDNNGNQTGITSTDGDYSSSTTFNVDNRMASAVTTFGSTTVNSTFVYDGEGERVKKIVGTTTTRYISKLYECDTTGTNTSCSRFIWAGETRIATIAVTPGTVHYWHGDHLGSSSVITNSTGAKVQALTYQPHGGVNTNQSFTTPAIDVPYKYTGKEFDYSTDFYYYESRYYDPWFGRFISPDSTIPYPMNPESLNRYSYVLNNPIKYIDIDGNVALLAPAIYGALAGGIGGLTGGLSQGPVHAATGFAFGFIAGGFTGAAFAPELSFQAGNLAAIGSATYVALATNYFQQVMTGIFAGAKTGRSNMTPLEAFVTQVNPYQLGLAGISAGKVALVGNAFKNVMGGHPGAFIESTYSGLHGGFTDMLGTALQSRATSIPTGTITHEVTLLGDNGLPTYTFRGNRDSNGLRDSFQIDKSSFFRGQQYNRQISQLPSSGGFSRINGGSMIPIGPQIFPNRSIGPGDSGCQWDGC